MTLKKEVLTVLNFSNFAKLTNFQKAFAKVDSSKGSFLNSFSKMD